MKKYDLILAMFWVLLGLVITIASYHLGLGKLTRPGDGLMSFGIGILLSLCGLGIFLHFIIKRMAVLQKKEEEQGIWSRVNFKRIALVLVSLIGYSLLLERLGFLVTTFLMLFVLFKSVGSPKWSWTLFVTALTVALTYLLFVVLLNVYMPSFPIRIG